MYAPFIHNKTATHYYKDDCLPIPVVKLLKIKIQNSTKYLRYFIFNSNKFILINLIKTKAIFSVLGKLRHMWRGW